MNKIAKLFPFFLLPVFVFAQNLESDKLQQNIKSELFKAKKIISEDNGKLWGKNIWSDDIIVLDFDNTIYAIQPLPDSETIDSILFYKKIPNNELGFSNAVQKYNGKEYAVILTNYLDDNSETIIHELFHILQNKHLLLNGEPITYLDNFDAREWLRLEYQALRNTLGAIDKRKSKSEVEKHIRDALVFKKIRQGNYKDYHQKEIEIETLEGLANYTGIVLSSYPNKYEKAIQEINYREQAETYTRSFPYATGPAYGLAFDYLRLDWKNGLDKPYDFLKIYETLYLKEPINTDERYIELAKKRNNYLEIHKQEIERKLKTEKLTNYYSNMFFTNPTLRATLITEDYSRTYDMNGTFVLDEENTVYSSIIGTSNSPLDFGDFKTLEGKEKLGVTGIVGNWKNEKMTFIFPVPLKTDGNTITGECYEISLNEGWEVKKINKKGDLEIVKREE